ncbi:MAG: hypothetical protein HC786_23860 [Richelia sp. CSU_2_1]|nr:hypothetical protein [Richelia sp. CSU_2_1]
MKTSNLRDKYFDFCDFGVSDRLILLGVISLHLAGEADFSLIGTLEDIDPTGDFSNPNIEGVLTDIDESPKTTRSGLLEICSVLLSGIK